MEYAGDKMRYTKVKPKRFGNLITISRQELKDFMKNQEPIVKKGFDLELNKADLVRLIKFKQPIQRKGYNIMLENVVYDSKSRLIDFNDNSKTENTRVSYPLNHIENSLISFNKDSKAGHPNKIIFLTCDVLGVLPAISRLTNEEAITFFLSGYTSKMTGTEEGVTEPTLTFSACFGAPFMPLHPTKYAEMLGKNIDKSNVNVWLINTGWSGGEYGVGNRMKIPWTRAMLNAALDGSLNDSEFVIDERFGVEVPTSCPGVPDDVLIPRSTWENGEKYDVKADKLAKMFIENFLIRTQIPCQTLLQNLIKRRKTQKQKLGGRQKLNTQKELRLKLKK